MKPGVWYISTFLVAFVFFYCYLVQLIRGQEIPRKYHNYTAMTDLLTNINRQHPQFTALYTIGKSVQGRELWVMIVSTNPLQHSSLKPNVKYVANMHGNEAVGREMVLRLILYLINSYHTDNYVKWLMDNTYVHLMPSMNPDGFEVSQIECSGAQGRYNAKGYDLNRNFPDYFKQNTKAIQPETKAVMEWLHNIQFTLSLNIHGGALVASYPFDNTPNSIFQTAVGNTRSITPDHETFKHLALKYSLSHPTMHKGLKCNGDDASFPNGTTNGAEWYPVTGGMQDYNYIWAGCMEITIEMSCCKYPAPEDLPNYWRDNQKSLLHFLGEVHRGVKGIVIDRDTGHPMEGVELKIKGRDPVFKSTEQGEYWRILMPGYYTVIAQKRFYEPTEVLIEVRENHVTVQNITMKKANVKNRNEYLNEPNQNHNHHDAQRPPHNRHRPHGHKKPSKGTISSFVNKLKNGFGGVFNIFG